MEGKSVQQNINTSFMRDRTPNQKDGYVAESRENIKEISIPENKLQSSKLNGVLVDYYIENGKRFIEIKINRKSEMVKTEMFDELTRKTITDQTQYGETVQTDRFDFDGAQSNLPVDKVFNFIIRGNLSDILFADAPSEAHKKVLTRILSEYIVDSSDWKNS